MVVVAVKNALALVVEIAIRIEERHEMNLDDLRAAHPVLGFALYAYEPGGAVTLEVHTPDGEVYTFTGPTASEAIETAFPPPLPDVFD